MRTGQTGPGIRAARRKARKPKPFKSGIKVYSSTQARSLGSGLKHSSTNYTRVPRMSQSQQTVAANGLVWGNRRFSSSGEFSKWLRAHGGNYATFAKRHGAAAAGLQSRGSGTLGGSSIGAGRPSSVGSGGSRRTGSSGSSAKSKKTKAQIAAARAAKLAQKVSMGTSYRPPGYGPTKKKKQQSPGGGTGQVAPYTRADGTPVKGYKRGTSQSPGRIQRQGGLVWGKRLFRTKSAFGRSLKAHGTSLSRFSTRHPSAFRGLK